jgi:hypothetical protein
MTMEASTSTPIEIAIPARDMMFVWMSAMPSRRSVHMMAKEASVARGSVMAMMNEVRKCRRMSRTQIVAVRIASVRVVVTVWTAPSIRGVRS